MVRESCESKTRTASFASSSNGKSHSEENTETRERRDVSPKELQPHRIPPILGGDAGTHEHQTSIRGYSSPRDWNSQEVEKWLIDSGFKQYANRIAYDHQIDGSSLLALTETDLREKPLALKCLGDIKKLSSAISRLKVESPDTDAKSLLKLVIAFFYCLVSLLITAFVMVFVHDRVPDMKTYPPLPDIVLDNLPLIPWAFEMCEMIGVVMSCIWFTLLFLHKQRVVIARRMFSLVGTVFLLRCITMMITSLSVPGVHLECRAKGVRSCGDYMFSGHTTAITLLNHFITEYTPDSWNGLHTLTWVLNLFGVFFILAGHEHYSIDVFVAFYISSRMFLYYHTYAYNHANLTATDDRMRIWFPLGWFFEAGSIGKVPNEFEFPIKIHWRTRRPSEAELSLNGAIGVAGAESEKFTVTAPSSTASKSEKLKERKKKKNN